MIKDAENEFSADQAITATARSTNHIDLGASGTPPGGAQALTRDIGQGKPIPILCEVVEAFTAAGAATLTVDAETDDNTGFSSAKNVWSSGAIAKATLVVGYQFLIYYVPRSTDERYFGLNYTVATGPFTAGKINAGIVASLQGGIGS